MPIPTNNSKTTSGHTIRVFESAELAAREAKLSGTVCEVFKVHKSPRHIGTLCEELGNQILEAQADGAGPAQVWVVLDDFDGEKRYQVISAALTTDEPAEQPAPELPVECKTETEATPTTGTSTTEMIEKHKTRMVKKAAQQKAAKATSVAAPNPGDRFRTGVMDPIRSNFTKKQDDAAAALTDLLNTEGTRIKFGKNELALTALIRELSRMGYSVTQTTDLLAALGLDAAEGTVKTQTYRAKSIEDQDGLTDAEQSLFKTVADAIA